MSKIDELIRKLCPDGVPLRTLSELAKIGTGSSDKKDADSLGPYPFYVRSKEVFRSATFEFDEIAILIPGEGGIGEIFHFNEGPYALHQRAYRVAPVARGLVPKYLYYFMVHNFRSHILSKAVSATVTSIRKPMIESFRVAVPPLEIQREIVSILDKFTQLEAELEAELEARRTQYEVTRDRLLDFSGDLSAHPMGEMIRELCPEGVTPTHLGKLGEFVRGSGLEKKDLLTEGLPVVHYGEVHTHYGFWAEKSKSFVSEFKAKNMKKAVPGDVVLVTTSENEEDVAKPLAWLGTEDLNVGGESYIFKSKMDPYFVAQIFLSSIFKTQIRKYISGTKVKRISASNLEKILVSVPPLAVQRAIGVSLKLLDSLVNDISYGLPAEIEARRKQYEYYRNKLLTFKELDAA